MSAKPAGERPAAIERAPKSDDIAHGPSTVPESDVSAAAGSERRRKTGPAAPFDPLAERYDRDFSTSLTGRAQRESVWRYLRDLVRPGAEVLDLGCGTGEDALWLLTRGARVTALDASPEMVEIARRKVEAAGFGDRAAFVACSIEALAGTDLEWARTGAASASFDLALSNFAAINCVRDLTPLAAFLALAIRPGGRLVLVVFAPRCLWEMLWYSAHRDPKRAFRRLFGDADWISPGGERVLIRYWREREIARALAPSFRLVARRGIGLLIPPSYMDPLAARWPRLLDAMAEIERPFLRAGAHWADHLLLDFERCE